MKPSTMQRWKRKQQRLYRKHSMNVKSRYKRKRDLSGKFVILLNRSRSKCAAVLKFLSKQLCKTKYAVFIDSTTLKMTSSRFIISPRKNRKLLRKIEVIVTDRFKKDYEGLYERLKQLAAAPKVSSIKIFSCATCNHKFTSKERFDLHGHAHEGSRSSDSETDLVIDDDVELILDDESFTAMQNLPEPSGDTKLDHSEAKLEELTEKFDSEEAPVTDPRIQHKKDPFMCIKCGAGFIKLSSLITHIQTAHPVEIIEPHHLPPSRGNSVYVKRTSQNGTEKQPEASAKPSTISFQRFDSSKDNVWFVCRFCSVSFDNRFLLDRHMAVYHVKKFYFCYKCHVSYVTGVKMLNHLREAHVGQINDTGYLQTISNLESATSFRCPFCNFNSKDRKCVSLHLTNEHYEDFDKSKLEEEPTSSPDSLENLILPETAKMLEDEKVLEEEEEEDLLVEVPEKKEKEVPAARKRRKPQNDPSFKFRCARCRKRFARAASLRKHFCPRGEAETQPVIEQLPSKPIPNSPKVHQKTMNGFFRCTSCPQVFTDRDLFNAHAASAHQQIQSTPVGFYGSNL